MKSHFLLFSFLFFLSAHLSAQHRVQFLVTDQSIIKPKDSIYISGTFNQWASKKNNTYLLQRLDPTHFTITLLLSDSIQYKFHRGDWQTVETDGRGADINFPGKETRNRKLFATRDTTVKDTIAEWSDDFVMGNLPRFLAKYRDDTDRLRIFVSVGWRYRVTSETFNLDSALWCAQQELDLFSRIKSSDSNYLLLEWFVKWSSAQILCGAGNYSKALELALEALQLAEQAGDTNRIYGSMWPVSIIYGYMKDYDNGIIYLRKLKTLIVSHLPGNYQNDYGGFLYLMAEYFLQSNQLDSSIHYAQQSYERALDQKNDEYISGNAELLGDIYSARNEDELAMSYYHQALHLEKEQGDGPLSKMGIAKLYQKKGNIDSALYYATGSWKIYQQYKTLFQRYGSGAGASIKTGELLSQLYNQNHQYDSAYKYLLITTAIKDSLFNSDKVRQAQILTFNESQRQQKLEEDRVKAAELRKRNLQFIGIAIFIPAFFLFILLLRRRKVNHRVISFLGVLSLLLVFEFIMLLLDPFVKQWTNDVPVLMLALLVILAAVLIPAHHKIEAWLKKKLGHQTSKLEKLPSSEVVGVKE